MAHSEISATEGVTTLWIAGGGPMADLTLQHWLADPAERAQHRAALRTVGQGPE